jgi:hypothetical protein
MHEGAWRSYAEARLSDFFHADVVKDILSTLDLSSNAKKTADLKKAILYDVPPTTSFDASPEDREALDLESLWAEAQHRHLMVNVANEAATRQDWSPERRAEIGTGISSRTVQAERLLITASAADPTVAGRVEELRERLDPSNPERSIWTWELWDARPGKAPEFRILSADRSTDLSRALMPPSWDGNYPYRLGETPLLPYELHHVRKGSHLWDPFSRSEITEGTLTAACLRSWWLCGVRDVAHPVRIGLDVDAVGSEMAPGRTVDRVTLPRGAILFLRSSGTHPAIQSLEPGMNAADALDAIDRYVASLFESDGLGIEPSNTSRMSGYAIVVTRDSLRRVQRQQEPAARFSDRRVLALRARLLNAYEGTKLPTDPRAYSIGYHGVERSLEEIRGAIEEALALQKAGLDTLVGLLRKVHPQLSDTELAKKADEIRAERAAERAAQATQPANATPERPMTDPSTGAPMRTPRGVADPDETNAAA